MKIKKGDNVIVISGKDKGKKGKVLDVFKNSDRISVEGVGLSKKHQKKQGRNHKGGIIEKTMPIHISNVAIADPKTGKPTRIRYEIKGDKKIRVAKKSGAALS